MNCRPGPARRRDSIFYGRKTADHRAIRTWRRIAPLLARLGLRPEPPAGAPRCRRELSQWARFAHRPWTYRRRTRNAYRRRPGAGSGRVIERYPSAGDGAACLVDGRPLRVFCSNDYLGLAQHPRSSQLWLQAVSAHLALEAARRIWSPAPARRHHQLEAELAPLPGGERALLFRPATWPTSVCSAPSPGRGEVVCRPLPTRNHAQCGSLHVSRTVATINDLLVLAGR